MISRGWAFLYQLATCYLLYLKSSLMASYDASEILVLLSCSQANKQDDIPWERIIASCARVTVP